MKITVDQYLHIFRFRGDTFAEQNPGGDYKRVTRGPTYQDLEDHLTHKRVLALYPSMNGLCWMGALDFDIPKAQAQDPEAWEGLDLRDDAGRFLGIAKVPYPDTRDPVIAGLMAIDKGRYFEDTIQKLRQGVGRIVRSSEDYGDIHILDAAFKKLYLYNQKQFPETFRVRVSNI